jgi:ribosome biogenesis GTPase
LDTVPSAESLSRLGWNHDLEHAFEQLETASVIPARVTAQHRGGYVLTTGSHELTGDVPGRMRHRARARAELPAVGDWVAVRPPSDGSHTIIEHVLPRRSSFSRNEAGDRTDEQVIATNIDVIFVVTALNEDFNLRRAERYLTMAWASGATPVAVLTKSDLCGDLAWALATFAQAAVGVPIHSVSAVTGDGIEELRSYLKPGVTGALLGSSGTGKSTLVNLLVGEKIQDVQAIREDGKGRHTTTARELIQLPGGGAIIDTPGMRELQLWIADEGLGSAFDDITELAAGCRFNDCTHEKEPGCAVKQALTEGSLPKERLTSYRKLQAELRFLERKQDRHLAHEEARRIKRLNKAHNRAARRS